MSSSENYQTHNQIMSHIVSNNYKYRVYLLCRTCQHLNNIVLLTNPCVVRIVGAKQNIYKQVI